MTARAGRCYHALVPLVNVSDFEALARKKLPQPIFDFIAGGAEDEVTLAANRAAFQRILLRPRVLVDVSKIDLSTTVLGQAVSMPILLAPVALQRLAHPDGELASARAAASAATIFTLSTMASCTIEDVAQAADGPKWFQLYVHPDRDVTKHLVQRAEAAGYVAICVTADVPFLGRRERDLRNRLEFPPDVTHVNYLGEVEAGPPSTLTTGLTSRSALSDSADLFIDPSLSWSDIDWLRSVTSLPVLVKGILTAEDAGLAVERGAAGVIVSNHGGRQLDGAPATIDVLPEIVEAVQGRCEVLLDGGVRRGSDVLKALAIGASAVLIGRPYVWGLAAGGEKGVAQVLAMLRNELELAIALCGRRSLGEIDSTTVRT